MNRHCDECNELYSEDDMDIVGGKWLCRECEDLITPKENKNGL